MNRRGIFLAKVSLDLTVWLEILLASSSLILLILRSTA